MTSPNLMRVILAALSIALLATAGTLEALGHPSANEWTAFYAVTGLLIGQHLEKPTP